LKDGKFLPNCLKIDLPPRDSGVPIICHEKEVFVSSMPSNLEGAW
jgi:hypothetical protein